MTGWRQKILAWTLMLALAVAAAAPGGLVRTAVAEPAEPGAVQLAAGAEREPGPAGMIIDGLVVRPLGLVATIIGSVLFVITLPFSAMGDNVGQAREKLVEAPAAFTFTSCLRCFGGDT
jgi:hypothetical protein